MHVHILIQWPHCFYLPIMVVYATHECMAHVYTYVGVGDILLLARSVMLQRRLRRRMCILTYAAVRCGMGLRQPDGVLMVYGVCIGSASASSLDHRIDDIYA